MVATNLAATTTDLDDLRRRTLSVPGSLLVASLFLMSLVFLVCCMDRSVAVFDESLMLVGATRVLDGAIPHRDFITLYGPAQFYILAALFKVFGASVLVERAWDTFTRCCIVVLVMVVVGQVAPRIFAFMAASASLVWVAAAETYGFPVFPAFAAALASLACLIPTFGRARAAPWLTAAGVWAGAVMLFRYDLGIATFGSECAILIVSAWFEPEDRAHRLTTVLRSVMWFSAGFAVVVLPVAVAFALCGVFPDLIFQVITYPAQYYVRMRSLPFPRPWAPHTHWRAFAVYLPLLLSAAATPTLVGIARRQWENKTGRWRPATSAALPWTLLALVVLTLVFYGKGLVRVSVVHLAMSLVTSMALAGVLAQPMPGRRLLGRGVVVAALATAAVLTLFALRLDLHYARLNVAWARNPASWEQPPSGVPVTEGSCRVPAEFQRMACFPITKETIDTVRYVQQHTSPDDPVFVGLSRHDKILINDVLLYFVLNRRPATKWYEFDPGLQTTAPIQQQMVGELQREKPKLIVLEAKWADAQEPNDSALSSGVTILDDYLRRTYQPVVTFGTNTILRPRSQAQP